MERSHRMAAYARTGLSPRPRQGVSVRQGGRPRVRFDRPQPYRYTDPRGVQTLAAGQPFGFTIRVRADLGFLWATLRIFSSNLAGLTVLMTDENSEYDFMNAPIVASLVSSNNARFPYWLPVETFLKPETVIHCIVTNTTGAPVTALPVLSGYKLSASDASAPLDVQAAAYERAFWYRYEIPAMAANATQQATVQMHAQPFVWSEFQANVQAGFDVECKPSSGDSYISTIPIPAELQLGDGERPGYLEAPYVFRPNEEIVIRGTDRGAGTAQVTGCLGGRKLDA